MAGLARSGRPSDAMSGLLRLSGGRRLRSPAGPNTRPTTARVREAVMNILTARLQGASWLDLCSGSGAMACEAIERGVSTVLAVEKDYKAAAICKNNLDLVAKGKSPRPSIQVIRRHVVQWLTGGRPDAVSPFELAYFDPPYESNLYQPTLDALFKGNWIANQGLVVCEHSDNNVVEPPQPWRIVDQRCYGKSALLLLSLPEHCLGDTDSKPPQIDPSR